MCVDSFLFIDFEFGRDGRFYGAAAILGDEEVLWPEGSIERALDALAQMAARATCVVGHNIHRFDLRQLSRYPAAAALLKQPSLDTLELSVISHPRRPYHRLVKDDTLHRDCKPAPLSDARASRAVLSDVLTQLAALAASERWLLMDAVARLEAPDTEGAGWAILFDTLGWRTPERSPDYAARLRGRVCQTQIRAEVPAGKAWLFVLAWLRTVHDDDASIPPKWATRAYPEMVSLVRALRGRACDHPDCTFCATVHSPEYWLERIYGYPSFRAEPAAASGASLQRILVERGLRGLPTFGILPTGGGKSLCFQLPAVARHVLLGELTVVISPLQSLMKDQVDALSARCPGVVAIYGGMPPLFRPAEMEKVRNGACGLLYLSPEQLRNNSIHQLLATRRLGAIVFDEAHCLSEWGHDFRTDYRYVLRALGDIARAAGQKIPPVSLFTATSQVQATEEIITHVWRETQQDVVLFDGGSKRQNLVYSVQDVAEAERVDRTVELLDEHLSEGSAIIFCGSRRMCEAVAEALTARGFPAEPYHAGLAPEARRARQDAFMEGHVRIIASTNAFGMGVDKDNVRLVVHLQIPSSLEAYRQEAGRGGRDGQIAHAVLLYSDGDCDARHRLGARSRISHHDLRALWRGIQRFFPRAGVDEEVVTKATARELLWMESVRGVFDPHDEQEESRVKAAVNWLEQANLFERRLNQTRVFTGSPVYPALKQAIAEMERFNLPTPTFQLWARILEAIYDAEEGLSADHIAQIAKTLSYERPREGGLEVLRALGEMSRRGLVSRGLTFAVTLSHGVSDPSVKRLVEWIDTEERVLALLEAHHSTHGVRDVERVVPREIAARISGATRRTDRDIVRLFQTWTSCTEGWTTDPRRPTFWHRAGRSDLRLEQPLDVLRGHLRSRAALARLLLAQLLERVEGRGKDRRVLSQLEDHIAALDGEGAGQLGLLKAKTWPAHAYDKPAAVVSALRWMHALGIIRVQGGLALFRVAMSLHRTPTSASSLDTGRLEALEVFQRQKTLRVHVVERWAEEMLRDSARGDRLGDDWFSLPIDDFLARWFPKARAALARPTTRRSYAQIVTSLNDAQQQRIVTRDQRRSMLVLAGPGSGKTRMLVHRVAWLVKVKCVRPAQILVLAYTRANAHELRGRLRALLGDDAARIKVNTLHGVALNMVAPSNLGRAGGEAIDLRALIPQATRLLNGEAGSDDIHRRDQLMEGRRYLFIDEYQDLDEEKYAFLTALTGRYASAREQRLRVFAVGDDDQAIFQFDGAKTEFIQRFETEYGADRCVVTQDYRNPKMVLELAEAMVKPLTDRMKGDTVLTVNHGRRDEPPAGPWMAAHPRLRGRLLYHVAHDHAQAAWAVAHEIRALMEEGVPAGHIAVLALDRPRGLYRVRPALERAGLPFHTDLPGGKSFPFSRLEEVVRLHRAIEAAGDGITVRRLRALLASLGEGAWIRSLDRWIDELPARAWSRRQLVFRLFEYVQMEARARRTGEGVHLGTIHGAKGLEFPHVLLFDGGPQGAARAQAEMRRLLYVAITRAKTSLQIFGAVPRGPGFMSLACHDATSAVEVPCHQVPSCAFDYGLVGLGDIWIDWQGLRLADDPSVCALHQAKLGDPFRLVARGEMLVIVDGAGTQVGAIAGKQRRVWRQRMGQALRLRLLAKLVELAERRPPTYRARLRDTFLSAIWEARWRPGKWRR